MTSAGIERALSSVWRALCKASSLVKTGIIRRTFPEMVFNLEKKNIYIYTHTHTHTNRSNLIKGWDPAEDGWF
jgi:hypothetical protein